MGRKTIDEFVRHWENVAANQPESDWHAFAHKMVDIPKIVFSKSVSNMNGKNVSVENGDLASAVNHLKNKSGRDILVYGGASFVSSLIKEKLIDEMYLFINPAIIGNGKSIFKETETMQRFSLIGSRHFDCGVIVLVYKTKI